MLKIYNIIYLILLILFFPKEYFKRPKCNRRRWLYERTGFYSKKPKHASEPTLWIHAVSVGETIAIIPLVRKLRQEITANIVISTVTDTGQEIAKRRTDGLGVTVVYAPFDTPFAVQRGIWAFRPDIFIVMETELWPATLATMKKNSIPVLLLNGRISDKSFKGYRTIKFFMEQVLKNIEVFAMQDETYVNKIVQLGASQQKTKAIGNLKYDIKPSGTMPKWAWAVTGKRIIIAGSTHEGEEGFIIDNYIKLMEEIPDMLLIIAPRHPERFDAVCKLIEAKHIKYERASNIGMELYDVKVVVLDSVGELANVYGLGEICIIGGSFIPKGGQNLLEPAYWQKPIICGPYMFNFPMVEEFLKADAAIMVKTSNEFYTVIKALLTDEHRQQEMGKRANNIYKKNAGTIERAYGEVVNILKIKEKR